MKEKFLIFSLITILGFLPYNIFCQYREAETFLEGFEGTGVYIDTTGISDVLEFCKNFRGRVYATKGYIIKIDDNIFDLSEILKDTFYINSIKPEFSYKKEQLKKIEQKFGKFYFDKQYDLLEFYTINKDKYFHITFDEIINVDSVIEYFTKISNYVIDFSYYPDFPIYVPNDRTLKPSSKPVDIQYQNIDSFYDMNFHKLGFGWNIYSLNLPLAWEISTGNRETVLSVYDYFGLDYTPHPDLPVKTSIGDPIGNWIYLNNNDNNFGDGKNRYTYPPSRASSGKNGDHGLTVLSMAIAKRNNDSQMQPAEGGLVGTCPDCLGMAFYGNNYPENEYYLYDTDLEVNGITKRINTLSISMAWVTNYSDYKELIDSGIVVLGAASNGIYPKCKCDGSGYESDYFGEPTCIPSNSIHCKYKYWNTIPDGKGANVYIPDVNDPTKDYKVIAVGGIMEGDLYDVNCDSWQCGNQVAPPASKGKEKFIPGWMFSPGVNKFSINPDSTQRVAEKKQAYMDVVAPGSHLTTATDSPTFYNLDVSGTSQAVPQVNGIVGLMNSVSNYLGVTLDENDRYPVNGVDVQRTAYDILTFTTKKIEDDGETPEPFWCAGKLNFVQKPSQPYYLIQHNDKLQRTWAQRVGFGKVNAYRALAHTIRQKGEYEYLLNQPVYTLVFASADGNGDSRGYVNPSGKKLMHWGSKVKEGTLDFELPSFRGPTYSLDANPYNVLDWGGTSLPGEFHNNQGITRINNTTAERTVITVPTDCILAIDGVLISDQPNACHYVITSGTSQESSGLILVEGYIKDIEVAGNLRIGDVILESTIDNGIQNEPGCLSFNCCDGSEIYGDIKVINKGFLYAWRGFTMFPGSSVELNGEKNLNIMQGGAINTVVTMKHATSITGIECRKVVLNSGTEMNIDKLAVVELNLELNIKDGAVLNLDSGAVAKIKQLNVEPGGTVNLYPNSILSLENPEQFINGHLNILNDSISNKPEIIGKLGDNCKPQDFEDYTSFEFIQKQPTIYMKGDCADSSKYGLDLKNAILKNVSINAYNIPIRESIENVDFLTKTELTNPYFNFDYLISLRYDNCQTCSNPYFSIVQFDNCVFMDHSTPEPPVNDPNNYNKIEYRTAGAIVEGYETVEFINSNFQNLEFGTSTFDCGEVKIFYSTFNRCGIGDYDFGSNTYLCNNNYNIVKYGSVRDNSLYGKAFNNIYYKVRIGYSATSSLEQRLRNNTFNEYLQGINTNNTIIRLNDIIENNLLTIYGRNEFSITQFPANLSGYVNPFITKQCEILLSADINISKYNSTLYLNCGYNKFSQYATYHLRYSGETPSFYGTINIDHNQFLPAYAAPRVRNLVAAYTNYDLINEYIEDQYNCCGDVTINTPELICNLYSAGGPEAVKGGPVIDCDEIPTINYNPSYIVNKKSIKEEDLNSTIAIYKHIFEIASNESNLRNLLLTTKAETEDELLTLLIDYKLDNFENKDNYSTDYKEHPTINHLYGKDKDDEILIGSMNLLGFVQKSFGIECVDGITNSINDYINNFEITKIQPNPFSNSTDIYFSSPTDTYLEIILVDNLGNYVDRVYKNVASLGLNKIHYDNKNNISSGVYYFLFKWEGGMEAKRVVIVK